ncbi:MFS transporter [Corynebacterium sp. H78]|uniref:MFS transporter n=1 Tax=Corynebacterium sp. H78 TaxID=3133417 RepID=UPI00309F176E
MSTSSNPKDPAHSTRGHSSHSPARDRQVRDRPHPREKLAARALVVWAAAVLVYIVAITGRTSLGVAGVQALDRFDIDASRLAVFTAVQVGVYALAQIPVGIIIDRVGARKTMVAGALLMAVGQAVLALSTAYPVAIGARILIGAGDATAFLAVMRLLPAWFPLKSTPVFTQLTAGLGQLGQFISAAPFLALLHAEGWVPAFLSIASGGAIIALAAAVAVRDRPDDSLYRESSVNIRPVTTQPPATPPQRASIRSMLGVVLRDPSCWQGFFTHWTGLLNQNVFLLLWGMPLMTLGMGLEPSQASAGLVINTVAVICSGPIVGMISSRLGSSRWKFHTFMTTSVAMAWVWFFLSPTPHTFIVIIVMNAFLGLAASTSNYGFDTVRENVDRSVLATGTGLSNMGGFVAAMVASQSIGVILDISSDGSAYQWADFRLAWVAVLVVWLIGMIGLFSAQIALRRRAAAAPSHKFELA